MKTPLKQSTAKEAINSGKQRSYAEVIEFLDRNWSTNQHDTSLSCIKKLDKAFGAPSTKLDVVAVTGTNGKSLTIYFATKLLKQEGLKVGAFYSPHIMTYNERFSVNNETIANKSFTDLANEVINMAEELDVQPNSIDVLTMMAFLYFKAAEVDVALMEIGEVGTHNPVAICKPKINAVTRITGDAASETEQINEPAIRHMVSMASKGTQVVSADQSKLNLQRMLEVVEENGAEWAMPIRKLAPLGYPFEQLHGRCAALAERIAYIYINSFAHDNAVIVADSLLVKKKGQRGRPTLEAKRHSELNPLKTLEQFWKDEANELAGRFQLLDKEKPSLLLDNASNLDAFENLLLGIRLLHYHRPLKGLTLLLGSDNEHLNTPEFLKLLRYFFKKTSGQVVVCPVTTIPGNRGTKSWDAEAITNEIKGMKIKAKSAKNFKEAFETAQKSVDERNGLVVIAGSTSLLNEYWQYKGIKKIN